MTSIIPVLSRNRLSVSLRNRTVGLAYSRTCRGREDKNDHGKKGFIGTMLEEFDLQRHRKWKCSPSPEGPAHHSLCEHGRREKKFQPVTSLRRRLMGLQSKGYGVARILESRGEVPSVHAGDSRAGFSNLGAVSSSSASLEQQAERWSIEGHGRQQGLCGGPRTDPASKFRCRRAFRPHRY